MSRPRWTPSLDVARGFADDGVAALGRVLDDDALARVRAAQAALAPEATVGPYAAIVHDGWRRSPALAALIPALATRCARALGWPALVLFQENLLSKPPGGEDMGWHQDFSYLPLDRPDGLTLWIALDDVDEVNGGLYYLPGTHRLGERRPGWGLTGDDDPRAALPAIEVPPDAPGWPAPSPAGHALIHHAYLLHRSPRNRTDRPRRTWVLSLVPPEARWAPAHAPHPRSAVAVRVDGQPLEDDLPRGLS